MQLANLQVGGMNVTTDLGAAATVSVVSGRQTVASQAQAHSGHNYRADCSECACLVTCCAAPTFSRVWRAQIRQPSPLPCWNSAGLHCPKALTRKALPHWDTLSWMEKPPPAVSKKLLFTGVVNVSALPVRFNL